MDERASYRFVDRAEGCEGGGGWVGGGSETPSRIDPRGSPHPRLAGLLRH
jgi:hypothetical protein